MSRERLIARAIAEITDDGTDFYMTAHPSTTPFNLPNGPIC